MKFIKTLISDDLVLPILLILIYGLFLYILKGAFPNSGELINTFSKIYGRFGYEIVFFASLLESLVLVNVLVPGGLALSLGVILTKAGENELLFIILVGAIAAILGYIIDYFLGFFGFSKVLQKTSYVKLITRANSKIGQYGSRGLILGFIHPNIGSFVSLTAGTLGFKFKKFITIALISTIFWSLIWGVVIYLLGDQVLNLFRKYGYLMVLIYILGIVLLRFWKEKE